MCYHRSDEPRTNCECDSDVEATAREQEWFVSCLLLVLLLLGTVCAGDHASYGELLRPFEEIDNDGGVLLVLLHWQYHWSTNVPGIGCARLYAWVRRPPVLRCGRNRGHISVRPLVSMGKPAARLGWSRRGR